MNILEIDLIVASTVRRYLKTHPALGGEKEDLYQEGYVAVLDRLRKNPSSTIWSQKQAVYRNLVSYACRNENLIRWPEWLKSKKEKKEEDKKIGEKPVIFFTQDRLEEIADEEKVILDPEWVLRLNAAIDCLPIRDAYVIRGLFLHGKTLMVMGKELGVSRERVRQIMYTALAKLQKMLSVRQLFWNEGEKKP